MASAKIEDRKKFLGGPWDVIKGKNQVLSKGLFKPPMDPLVDKYDKHKGDYDDLVEKKKELKAFFAKWDAAYNTAADSSTKLHDEFDKAKSDEDAASKKNYELLQKLRADEDPDPKEVIAAFSGLAAAFDEASTVRKTINDKLSALNANVGTTIKKFAADYKTQSDAITNGIKKLETELNSLDDQIRKLTQTYQQLAIKMDKEEVADAVRGLLSFMP
jgi:predicted nuclease with TOPRIM domain